MDENTTLTELKKLVAKFVAEREWENYHRAKNLSMSIAIEAAELMEHFQWLDSTEERALLADPERKAEMADELADVLIYILSFANSTGLDLSEIVQKKMNRNETRFPPVR